jgi:hypothetical protein
LFRQPEAETDVGRGVDTQKCSRPFRNEMGDEHLGLVEARCDDRAYHFAAPEGTQAGKGGWPVATADHRKSSDTGKVGDQSLAIGAKGLPVQFDNGRKVGRASAIDTVGSAQADGPPLIL